MNETKFTPEPWAAIDYSDGNKGLLAVVTAGEARRTEHICEVFPFGTRPGGLDRSLDEHRANTHLIAAAPDLYEAAKLLEDAEEAHANCDECDGEGVPELCPKCFPLFDDARVKRRLALAKAEGRTP